MSCVHHWVIAIPDGPQSKGKCKKCKETKLFNNGGNYWKDDWNITNAGFFDEYTATGRRAADRNNYE